MQRACLLLLAGMYAAQLSSFDAADGLREILVAWFLLASRSGRLQAGWLLAGAGLFFHAVLAVVESRLDPAYAGDSIVAAVRVVDFPRAQGDAVSFIGMPTTDARLPPRIRLTWFEPRAEVRPGDVWEFELRLRRPRGLANPATFDAEGWFTRERIGATGYVVSGPRNRLLRGEPPGPVQRVRARFVHRVETLGLAPERAAVLCAVVVGARHAMTNAQWDRYARTGTSHLMAISGLHIGLAAAGGYLLATGTLVALRLRGNMHLAACAAGVALALAYGLISGLGIPSRRAILMVSVAAACLLRRRRPDVFGSLVLAGAIVAIADPLSTMAPGFRLSFAAVAWLAWLARQSRSTRRHSLLPRVARTSATLLAVQVFLWFGMAPVTASSFDRLSFAAPLANLVAVPVFSLVTVPLALTGLLLDGPLQRAGDASLAAAAHSIGWIEALIDTLARWPLAARNLPEIGGAAWALLLLPALWALLPRGWPGRGAGWVAVVALACYQPARPHLSCADVHVLDVGQGLAVVVETQRHTLVFDTGPGYRDGGDAATNTLVPFLQSRGTARVDRLIVSHADVDHAGGVASVMESTPARRVLAGEPINPPGIASAACRAGQAWRWDGVEFRILHPPAEPGWQGNDASCVVLVSAGGHRLLLPGDIEARGEARLLASGSFAGVDVVVVPHHGSATSSTPAFVTATRPAAAIVSAGYDNRWGQPKPHVVARWRESGATVLSTAASGAIRIGMCAGKDELEIREYRRERRRIWQE